MEIDHSVLSLLDDINDDKFAIYRDLLPYSHIDSHSFKDACNKCEEAFMNALGKIDW